MSSNVARFAGLDATGGPMFDIVVSIPDETKQGLPCTERQLKAAQDFYCAEFSDGLTYSQAHQLLSHRQYAISCASYISRDAHPKWVLLYARVMAAFISSEPKIAAYAVARSDMRFRSGVERERVSRTKFFSEMLLFFESLAVSR
jgi:hypothetical protein